jgi:flagellin
MVINTNLQAQFASTRLTQSSSMLNRSLERLSSGAKIVSPADDSAGLAQSMKLSAQMKRLDAAMSNLENAISFTQTQDSYLAKVGDAFTRMSELAIAATDPTKTTSDRMAYNQEYTALGKQFFAIGNQTFNGVDLFKGATLNVTNDSEGNTFALGGVDFTFSSTNATYFYAANNTIGVHGYAYTTSYNMKLAVEQLASDRAKIGTNLQSLAYYHDQLAALKDNLSAANSRITDVDVARESTTFAKYNILVQTGTAMLAQANAQPQSVLKLISG